METYVRDWYLSRWVEIWEEPLPCENCLFLLLNWDINSWVKPWIEVHHIETSMRWKRKHNVNGDNLILLCRQCHNLLHNKNGWCNRENTLAIARESIIVFNRMKCKEKLRALVEFLYLKHIDDKINWVHQKTD